MDGILVDWGMQSWSEGLGFGDVVEIWLALRRALAAVVAAEKATEAVAAAAAVGTSDAVSAVRNGSSAIFYIYKQDLFVDIVVEHAHSFDACRQAERDKGSGSAAPVTTPAPRPHLLANVAQGHSRRDVVKGRKVRCIHKHYFKLHCAGGHPATYVCRIGCSLCGSSSRERQALGKP